MVIKIDVDGVIRDITSAMCYIYNTEFAEDDIMKYTPDDITDYDINKHFPLISEKENVLPTDYFFRTRSEQVFKTLSEPFKYVRKAIDMLRNNGNKVVIVTWQYGIDNIRHTVDFFDLYDIGFDDICFTKDKWRVRGDYLIDDNPSFLLEQKDMSKKIVIDAPYNRYLEDAFPRFNSLYDAARYLIVFQKRNEQ